MPHSVLLHAFHMVRKNLRSYLLLSVTITLSFSALLGYFLFSDSKTYNQHKDLFRKNPNIIFLDADSKDPRYGVFLQKTEGHYDIVESAPSLHEVPYPRENDTLMVEYKIQLLPSWIWRVYDMYVTQDVMEVHWLDGQERDGIALSGNEVILEETMYQALGLDGQEEPMFYLPISFNDGAIIEREKNGEPGTVFSATIPLRVVATVQSSESQNPAKANGDTHMRAMLLLSRSFWQESHLPMDESKFYVYLYAEHPMEAFALARSLDDLGFVSIANLQNIAKKEILQNRSIQTTISIALMVLLSINLYSSFSNALSSRTFEIGVKRAIGASKFSVIRQFLYEGLIVMSGNILISVSLVLDAALVYKYFGFYPLSNAEDTWIIYLTPYSIAMFSICAISLTVVFSLIFAWQSTRVAVVDTLKAE